MRALVAIVALLAAAQSFAGVSSGTGSVSANTTPGQLATFLGSREFSVTGQPYNAVCDGTTDATTAIQAAEDAAELAGGGEVVFPNGICIVSSTITRDSNRVVWTAKGFGDVRHDTGSNTLGAVLRWGGNAGGTIVSDTSVSGASNQAVVGLGMQGITLDCNSSAGIGLKITSTKAGRYTGVKIRECTTAGLDIETLDTANLGDASDPNYNIFDNLRISEISAGGNCILLNGASAGGANASNNTFNDFRGQYKAASCIKLANADSNKFNSPSLARSAASGTSTLNGSISAGATTAALNTVTGSNPVAGQTILLGTSATIGTELLVVASYSAPTVTFTTAAVFGHSNTAAVSWSGAAVELTGDANAVARSNVFSRGAYGAGGIVSRGTETLGSAVNSNSFPDTLTTNGTTYFANGTGVARPFATLDNGKSTAVNGGSGLPILPHNFTGGAVAVTWTNMPSAATIFNSSGRHVVKEDLSRYSQVRFQVYTGATACNTSGQLELKYGTAISSPPVASDFGNSIGGTAQTASCTGADTFVVTSWANLVSGALADVFLGVVGSNGDGAIDPVFGTVEAQFR